MAVLFLLKHIDMKIGLTMRTLIRWEQLRNKSFSLMDYSNEEDIEALLYCSVLCCNPGEKMYTLEVFRNTMQSDKLVKQMAGTLARESSVMAQFRKTEEVKAGVSNDDGTPGCIRDIVSTLIMGGLDADFAMDKMELCDLSMFIDAYQDRKKEQMESDRLWTYLTVLPHVDYKHIPDVRSIYPFPWEMEEMKAQADKAIQEDTEKLEMFFNQGKNLIDQNYG